MNNQDRIEIYKRLEHDKGITFGELHYVPIKTLTNHSMIAIDNTGRLLMISENNYLFLELPEKSYGLICLFEEDYDSVKDEFDKLGINMYELLEIKDVIRVAFDISPYWGECAYEWLTKSDILNHVDYIKELEEMTRSLSLSQKFRHRVRKDIEGFI